MIESPSCVKVAVCLITRLGRAGARTTLANEGWEGGVEAAGLPGARGGAEGLTGAEGF
ncbi:hypothetical protein EI94DRAFT_1758131 [Lactarius quietus]|nr:hypothetical protein EI94DRAFT_1758131 [Lactarius quietus]